jgi:hypothetical protein
MNDSFNFGFAKVNPDSTIEASFYRIIRDDSGAEVGREQVKYHNYSVEFKADFIAEVTAGGGDPDPIIAEAGW